MLKLVLPCRFQAPTAGCVRCRVQDIGRGFFWREFLVTLRERFTIAAKIYSIRYEVSHYLDASLK